MDVPQFLFLGGRRFGWEITSTEYQPLLTSAVREGTWIALANIRQICNKLGVEPPRSKQGSGKGGSVLKVDWAKQLVEHLFPEASNPEKKNDQRFDMEAKQDGRPARQGTVYSGNGV